MRLACKLRFLLLLTALVAVNPSSYGNTDTVATAQPSGFDVDASSTEIRLVIEALAQVSNANIVVSPEVKGEITARLKQMPLEQILDHLATAAGFVWERTGDTYFIGPPKPPPQPTQPEPTMLVWQCKYVKPADLAARVQELFPNLKTIEGPGTSTPLLDTGKSTSAGSSASPQSTTTPSITRHVVVMGNAADVEKAHALCQQLDIPRPQVTIKVQITEISGSVDSQIGLKWSYSDVIVRETAPDAGIKFGKFSKDGMTFTGVISALIEDGKAKLLAEPTVSVLDSEQASILIGDRIMFPKLVGYNQFGTPIYDKEEEEVGIYLRIVPKVTGKDTVVLTLYPQVSLVTGFLKTQAGDYPQISTRETNTTVSVTSGETLAIGGLLRQEEITNLSKIPLLGDLPIIGQLFRHTKKTTEQTEIVILLTPTVVE